MNEYRNRQGEAGDVPFRSSRFFSVGSKWYFSTREGFDSGPYADKTRAMIGLEKFLHIVSMLPRPEQVN